VSSEDTSLHIGSLLIIDCSPGEPLPKLPEPDHGPGTSRQFIGINDAISIIPRGYVDHEIPVAWPPHQRKNPYSGDDPANFTVTCNGGGERSYHPSGNRAFSVRELACIQGFPLEHRFNGTRAQRIKQIGNAVPPVFAAAIFRQVEQSMRETDRKERAAVREATISID
jgi:DNA (cytosine-5)-methyltransferase 1